jgi:hypothetical protein
MSAMRGQERPESEYGQEMARALREKRMRPETYDPTMGEREKIDLLRDFQKEDWDKKIKREDELHKRPPSATDVWKASEVSSKAAKAMEKAEKIQNIKNVGDQIKAAGDAIPKIVEAIKDIITTENWEDDEERVAQYNRMRNDLQRLLGLVYYGQKGTPSR